MLRVLLGLVLLLASAVAASSQPAGAPVAGPPPPKGELAKALVDGMLSIDEAVAVAWESNLSLRRSEEAVQAAQGRVEQALSAQWPRLTLDGAYRHIFKLPAFSIPGGGAISLGTKTTTSATATITMAPYTGGKVGAAIRATRAGLKGARADETQQKQEVTFSTRRSYYGVLAAQQASDVAQTALSNAESHLKIARARVDAEVAAPFDQLLAEVQVARAQEGLIIARHALELAKASLNFALGVDLDHQYELTTPPRAPKETGSLLGLETQALAQRPELVSLRAAEDAAGAAIVIAKADQLPNLIVGGDYQKVFQSSPISTTTPAVFAQLTMTLFDAGQTRGAIVEAQANLDQARTARQQVEQSVLLEVRQAYLNLQAASQRLETTRKEIESATEANRIAEVRYEGGVGTILELVDAQLAFTQAQLADTQASFDYNIAQAQLELATGR